MFWVSAGPVNFTIHASGSTWADTNLEWTLTADARSDHHCQPRRQSSAWWSLPLHSQMTFKLDGTFQAWQPRRDSPMGSNLESLGPIILFNEPKTVRCVKRDMWAGAPSWWKTTCETAVAWRGQFNHLQQWSISKSVSSSQHQKSAVYFHNNPHTSVGRYYDTIEVSRYSFLTIPVSLGWRYFLISRYP